MAKSKIVKRLPFPIIYIAALSLTAVVLALVAKSSQAGPDKLDWQKEVVKKECVTTGSPVINVTQKVTGSVDSGQAGNYWAFDTYNRQIQVWKQTDGSYCALLDYEGKFDSQAGQTSPGNTGTLTGKEDGNFKGGYRARITGALKDPADLNTQGSIGTVDYQCNLSGVCPGAFNWLDKYFTTSAPGFTFSQDWWGWQYRYKGAVWINSSDGNSGDIL